MKKDANGMKRTIEFYYTEIMRTGKEPAPWHRMIVCMLATALPLLTGLFGGHLAVSIYGSLAGYLLALNDHLGPIKKRLQIMSLTFVFLTGGFALGLLLHHLPLLFFFAIAVFTYWVGVLGGQGAELERAGLFLIISLVISYFSKPIPVNQVASLFDYTILAYACTMVAIPLLSSVKRRTPWAAASIRQSFKKSLTRNRENHIHATSFTVSVLIAIFIAQAFAVERGYWIVITVLLVMRADRAQSLVVTAQRLIGTALGVMFCDLSLFFRPAAPTLIFWVAICAFVIPYALKKNYLYASFFITTFVVSLLEIAHLATNAQTYDNSTAFLRLRATALGCGISVIGTAISKLLAAARAQTEPEP